MIYYGLHLYNLIKLKPGNLGVREIYLLTGNIFRNKVDYYYLKTGQFKNIVSDVAHHSDQNN